MVKEKYNLSRDLFLKAIFPKVKYKDRQQYNLLMEIPMKVNGKTIKRKDLECTSITQVPFTKVTGRRTCKAE